LEQHIASIFVPGKYAKIGWPTVLLSSIFEGIQKANLRLLPAPAVFLSGLLFDSEDSGNVYLRNVRLSPKPHGVLTPEEHSSFLS
jgi:hypothetical protein